MKNRNRGIDGIQRQEKRFDGLMLAVCLCFYAFFAFLDGAVIAVDSQSYIDMEISREPMYPATLALFRAVFSWFGYGGTTLYLTAVAWFQSILMALSVWSLVRQIRKEFCLKKGLSLLLLFVPLFVSLLCRFAAGRSSMFSNSILTEGITIPLYLLFFRYLLEYGLHQTKKSGFLSLLVSFIMIAARKQMIIALALWTVVAFYCGVKVKKVKKGIFQALFGIVLVLLCAIGFDLGYNQVVRGEWVTHSSDSRFMTTMAFYTAEREDAEYIEDEEIRELFLVIYDECDGAGYLMHSAGEGWLNRVTHFGDHYDNIQIDTMWPLINEYVLDTQGGSTADINHASDEIMEMINKAVLPHNLGKLLICFVDNFFSGLVTTVAQRKGILIVYSWVIYALYLLLWIVLLVQNHRENKRGKKEQEAKEQDGQVLAMQLQGKCTQQERLQGICLLAGLTLISIVINVGLVSLVIFCQTRYTIYNMPLFYISFLLMADSFIHSFCNIRRKHTC